MKLPRLGSCEALEYMRFIRNKPGNGHYTWVWHDNWHPFWVLRNRDLEVGLSMMLHASNDEAKLCYYINSNGWNMPSPVSIFNRHSE